LSYGGESFRFQRDGIFNFTGRRSHAQRDEDGLPGGFLFNFKNIGVFLFRHFLCSLKKFDIISFISCIPNLNSIMSAKVAYACSGPVGAYFNLGGFARVKPFFSFLFSAGNLFSISGF